METSVYRIYNICSIKSGKRLPLGVDFSIEPTKYRYIRSRDIKAGKICLDEVAFIDEETKKRINKYIINTGDVAITIVANIGDIGYATPDCDGINLTENAVRLTAFNETVVYSKYLSYYLKQSAMKIYMENLAAGAAQAKLGIYKIEKMKVLLPNVTTQKRIVEVIEKYDNLIEVNNKRIKALEQMAENLYKEWFVRFRFPGHETAEFENGIPKGWETTRLGHISNISTGKSNRQDANENGQYPFFDRSQEIKRSNIWLKDCEGIIVPGEGTSFVPKYYQGKFDLHQRCYCVEPKYDGMGKYLYYVLYLNRHYFLSVATGATVPSLRLNNFLSMKFVLPTIELCKRFNEIASQIFNQVDNYRHENENLIKQRDLLLLRLMSGKLEV